jgi:hypothetical protein
MNKTMLLFFLIIPIIFTLTSCKTETPCNKDVIRCDEDGSYIGRDITNNCDFFSCPDYIKVKYSNYTAVRCGGKTNFGIIECECKGHLLDEKEPLDEKYCPTYCPGEYNLCKGTCGECKCYLTVHGEPEEIPCDGLDTYFK